MGIPQHYSLELPERCMHLVDILLPRVENVKLPGQEHLGPLTTTFILAMSTPMILLPIERIERHRGRCTEAYVDDRQLDRDLAQEVEDQLGGREFNQSKFFKEGIWRFASIPYHHTHNVAREFPKELREKLAKREALSEAAAMPASNTNGPNS